MILNLHEHLLVFVINKTIAVPVSLTVVILISFLKFNKAIALHYQLVTRIVLNCFLIIVSLPVCPQPVAINE